MVVVLRGGGGVGGLQMTKESVFGLHFFFSPMPGIELGTSSTLGHCANH